MDLTCLSNTAFLNNQALFSQYRSLETWADRKGNINYCHYMHNNWQILPTGMLLCTFPLI